MVHFACHAAHRDAGADALIVSLIDLVDFGDVTDRTFNPPVIELDTNAFTLRQGAFKSRPLIFLNACHSGGGADELRETYNLPRVFIERGAGAVIATACPIPDIFAAEFARVFYSFFLRGRDPAETIQDELGSSADDSRRGAAPDTLVFHQEIQQSPGTGIRLVQPSSLPRGPSPGQPGNMNAINYDQPAWRIVRHTSARAARCQYRQARTLPKRR